MSNLQPFQFGDAEIRFVGTADKPEWVAADVIAVLYPESNARNRASYLRRIPSEWRNEKRILAPYGNAEEKSTMRSSHTGSSEDSTIDEVTGSHRENHIMRSSHVVTKKSSPEEDRYRDVATITEPGLYHLIVRSNSPIAVPFQKWVFEEVLPSIRKTGEYSKPKPTAEIELNHAVLSLPEAVALGDAVELVGDYGSGPLEVVNAVCEAIKPQNKRFAEYDIERHAVFYDTYSGVQQYLKTRDVLADALLICGDRATQLEKEVAEYLETCEGKAAEWTAIAVKSPTIQSCYNLNGDTQRFFTNHVELLTKSLCDSIEDRGRGRWISPTIFQLND